MNRVVRPTFLSNEYKVDNYGIVYGKNGKSLKPSVNHRGYQIVNFMINKKRKGVAVHTLVARAFCDGYKDNLQVNHIDGDKNNNRADNLEWVTSAENIHHAINVLNKNTTGKNNGNARSIIGIDKNNNKIKFDCIMDAARFFKPNSSYKEQIHVQNCIYNVLSGRRKSYRNYTWLYNE